MSVFDGFEELFDLPTLIVGVFDRQGNFVAVNSAQRRLLGFDPQDYVGKSVNDFIHPDDIEPTGLIFARLQQPGGVIAGFRNRALHRDGSYRWISWNANSGKSDGAGLIYVFGTDVTELVELEQRLREQRNIEKRYRTFFEQSTLPMQIYDTAGFCVAANPAWEALFATSKDALTGYNILKDPQVEKRGLLPYLARAYGGEACEVAPTYYHPGESGHSGRGRWIQAWFSPIKDTDGQVRELAMILKDVTGERAALEALTESENRFRVMADAAPVMIWMAGVDGQVTYLNRPWLDFTGRDEATELGEGWTQGIHPADFVRTVGQFQTAFAERREFRMEFRLRRADGEYRVVLGHGVPRFSKKGEFQGYVGVNNDVTDAKRAERAIEDDRRWLEKLLDSLPIPTMLIDPSSGAATFANSAAHRLMGGEFSLSVPVERYHTAYRLTNDQDRPLSNDETPGAALVRGRAVHDMEMVWHTVTGRHPMLFNTEIVPAQFGHSATGIITAQDVSRIKETEAQLKSALDVRDEFLSVASHELRTPITSLALQLQLRLRKLARGERGEFTPERLQELLVQDLRRLDKLTRVIEDTIDMVRIGADRLSLQRESADLGELVNEAVRALVPQFEATGAGLRLDVTASVRLQIDPFRIEQALQNILINALKYGEGKPVSVRLSVIENTARIEIRDSGRGIDPADHGRIFGRFERAVPAGEIGGMGLGLYIASEIITRHGGRIRVESERGRGACFIVELPINAPSC